MTCDNIRALLSTQRVPIKLVLPSGFCFSWAFQRMFVRARRHGGAVCHHGLMLREGTRTFLGVMDARIGDAKSSPTK